jgi:L-lactate dehydrogenase complex protein LldG
MSSREKILNSIKANQPESVPVPEVIWPNNDFNVETFMTTLRSIGGETMIAANGDSVKDGVTENFGGDKYIVSYATSLNWNKPLDPSQPMENIEVAIIEGHFGVAENGAIWIDGETTGHRVVPFICQHLVIVIHENNIVPTMHHAYSRIDVTASGFGVFIAGPSKTADIEQALVIGAHGARSLTVYILRD